MEEAISAAPVLKADEGGVLVKVQSQKDSEMYRIAKVCKVLRWTHIYMYVRIQGCIVVVLRGGMERMWDYECTADCECCIYIGVQ